MAYLLSQEQTPNLSTTYLPIYHMLENQYCLTIHLLRNPLATLIFYNKTHQMRSGMIKL